MTFDELFKYFKNLYGRNNKLFYTSLGHHTDKLGARIKNLRDAIVKQPKNIRLQEELLGNMIARTFAIAGFFFKLPLNKYMCKKFPVTGCGYCGHEICDCSQEKRDAHVEIEVAPIQLEWTLTQHQDHLAATYGHANKALGIQNAINRLFCELFEITSIASQEDLTNASPTETESAYAREIADVIAWILGIATLLEINVEQVVMKIYGNGCPICHSMPCECTRFAIQEGKVVVASSRPA